jgi:hypothetical protein
MIPALSYISAAVVSSAGNKTTNMHARMTRKVPVFPSRRIAFMLYLHSPLYIRSRFHEMALNRLIGSASQGCSGRLVARPLHTRTHNSYESMKDRRQEFCHFCALYVNMPRSSSDHVIRPIKSRRLSTSPSPDLDLVLQSVESISITSHYLNLFSA